MDKLVGKNALSILAKSLDSRSKKAIDEEKARAVEVEESLNSDIQVLSGIINELNYNDLLGFDTSEIVFGTENIATTAILGEGELDKLILDYAGYNNVETQSAFNVRMLSEGYNKQGFEPGQVLKAEHLNHMEDGIITNESIINGKQDVLINGENIKTINNQSILGSGNINIESNATNIYANFKGKCASILGDSISTYVEADGTRWIPNNWVVWYGPKGVSESGKDQLAISGITDVNMTWWKQTLNNLGLKLCTNASWSGSTVCGSSSDTSGKVGCGNRRIQALASDGVLKSEVPAGTTPDIIIIFIGINDFSLKNYSLGSWDMKSIPAEGTYNTFSEAYGLMLGKVMKTYPNAEIFCCTLLETTMSGYEDGAGFPTNSTSGCYLKDYNDVIENIARLYGVNIIDLHACGINYFNMSSMTGDKLHPNLQGATLMARKATAEIYAKSIYGHMSNTLPELPEQKMYTVTYNYVSSDGKTIKASTSTQAKEGATITISTSNAPSITGYTVNSVSPSGSITVNEDIVVTYTYNVNQYTVTYKYVDTDGNTVQANTTTTVKYGDVIVISKDNAPTIEKYSIESVSHNGSITVTGNMTITYTYLDTSKVYYNVTYKYVNASGVEIQSSTTQKVLEGAVVTIPASPAISNHVFVSASHNGNITVNNDIVITYTYRALESYIVTYKYVDMDGVEIKQSTTQTVLEGTNLSVSAAPTINDYMFVSASHSGNITVNENLTVTYTYKAVTMYNVIYNYVDADGNVIQEPTIEQVIEGTTITINTSLSIDGYNVVSVSPSGSIVVNSDIEITVIVELDASINLGTIKTNKWIQYGTGTEKTLNNWKCTDFIEIPEHVTGVYASDITAYNDGSNTTAPFSFYDENKAYIDGYATPKNNATTHTTGVKGAWRDELRMNIPEGAKYVRFCWTIEMYYKHETTGVSTQLHNIAPVWEIGGTGEIIEKYTVTYKYVDGNGNELQPSVIERVNEGTTISIPNASIIDGYEFVSVSHNGNITINEDLTVTYTYKVKAVVMYTVTYKYVDTLGQIVQDPITEQVAEGTVITKDNISLSDGQTVVSLLPSDNIVVESDIEVTIILEADMTIDIGTEKTSRWVEYGTGAEKTLGGWKATEFIEIPSYANAVYVPDITAYNNGTNITAPISFYDENQAWIDGFQSPVNNATSSNKGAWRDELQMNIPEGAKYVRFSWTIEANYKHETTGVTERLYGIAPEWMIDSISNPIPKYTVTYRYVDMDGIDIQQSTTQTVSEGSTIAIPAAPTINGYVLIDASHSGNITIDEDLIVIYTYRATTTYTVTYRYVDTLGQIVQDPTTEQVAEGTTITVNTSFSIDGYDVVSVSPNGNIVVNSDIEITVTLQFSTLIDASDYKDKTWIAYGTGEESTLNNWRSTDYIEIPSGVNAVYVPDITAFNNGSAITTPISFYDENQIWISGFESPLNNNTTSNKGAWRNELQMDIPENAKYVRFCWSTETNYKNITTGATARLYNIAPEWKN